MKYVLVMVATALVMFAGMVVGSMQFQVQQYNEQHPSGKHVTIVDAVYVAIHPHSPLIKSEK